MGLARSQKARSYSQVSSQAFRSRFFKDCAEDQRFGLAAKGLEVAGQVGVFGGKDRFIGGDVRPHVPGQAVVKSVFGDGDVVDIYQVSDHVGGVFLADSQSAFVGFFGQPEGVLQLVSVDDREARSFDPGGFGYDTKAGETVSNLASLA